MIQACIGPGILSDFLAGRISGEQALDVESHLGSCDRCQSLAAQHSSKSDSLLAAAKSAAVIHAVEIEPELAAALSAIGRLRSPSAGGFAGTDPTRAAEPEIHNYRLIEKLGEGGMGTVYRAVHVHLEKTVALKIMKADRSGNPQAVSRFEREMKAIGRLEHPHIVRALDAGEEQGVYFLAMEYIDGIDLEQLVRAVGRLPTPVACEIARQAALGLAHAHEHNLIHRDVKPSNLMLSPQGHVKVLDLGLAQFQEAAHSSMDLTHEGQLIGTLLYMSPEQLAGGRHIDARSDIYSLGVTLYCLLAGGLPPTRGRPTAPLPGIRSLRTEVPQGLDDLLCKFTATEPADRVATMSQVALSLEEFASGVPAIDLVRQAGRHASGAVLPPTVLPARARTSSPPAAEVPTSPASEATTAVAPVGMPTPNARQNRNWRIVPWVGAGVLAVSLSVLMAFLVFRNNEPKELVRPEVTSSRRAPGLVNVTSEQPGLPDFLTEYPVRLADTKSNAEFRLAAGITKVPPGTYRVQSQSPDVVLPFKTVTVTSGEPVELRLRLPLVPDEFPWQFARIPVETNGRAAYNGTLWNSQLPAGREITFDLRLQSVKAARTENADTRWLIIEVITHASEEDYKETAWLLVNARQYEDARDLNVTSGWIEAESKQIRKRLDYLSSEMVSSPFVVPYNSTDDAIKESAEARRIRLPPERISVHDALVLLFGASVPTAPAPVRTLRAKLAADSKRPPASRETIAGSFGKLDCLVYRSGADEPNSATSATYRICRSSGVPFGFVELNASSPVFRANCKLADFKTGGEAATVDTAKLAADAGRFAGLKWTHQPFNVASLPKDEGATARYRGEIRRGTGPPVLFTADLTIGAPRVTDGTNLQRLDVTVSSQRGADKGPVGIEHSESAVILVDVERHHRGDFAIRESESWLTVMHETFPFAASGVLKDVEDGLWRLEKSLPEARLTVHDVLALLFDARLAASADLGGLRSAVSAARAQTGIDPLNPAGEITLYDGQVIQGEIWEVKREAGIGLSYRIERSRKLPFDFSKVKFQAPSVDLRAALVEYQSKGVIAKAPSQQDLVRLAANTQRRIVLKSGDNNVLAWRDSAGKIIDVAEFGGVLTSKIVRLKLRDGSVREIRAEQLSKADREWIDEGRFWRNTKGWVARYATWNLKGDEITFVERNGVKKRPIKLSELSTKDQEWVREFQESTFNRR